METTKESYLASFLDLNQTDVTIPSQKERERAKYHKIELYLLIFFSAGDREIFFIFLT